MKLAALLGFTTIAISISGKTNASPIDLLAGGGFAPFQATSHWHRVERAVDVPDRMELTTKGNSGEVLVNSHTKDISIPCLFTRESFGDVRVELEFMIPKESNAGIYLMGRYEVQIFDSFGKEKVGSADLGGIYARWDRSLPANQQWSEGTRPQTNAAKAPGQWQNMEIVFHAPRFDADGNKTTDATFESVHINGKLVQQNATTSGPTASNPLPGECASGPIAIQGDHGPIAIRRFIVTPLDSPATIAHNEVDAYWAEVERAVSTGDFAAYRATIHPDAVIIAGSKQASFPLAQALKRWQADFVKTKSGDVATDLKFRFAHRYRDTNTAHESGIFRYIGTPKGGETEITYVAFEALLTKKDGRWQMLMEYQKGPASEVDWNALPE